MTKETLCMVMDDTSNYSPEEIAAFEATLDPKVVADLEARADAMFDEMFGSVDKAA